MLFHALAPVWARAQGPALLEMCSAVGNKWVVAPEGAVVSGGKQELVQALGIDNLGNKKYWAFHPYPQRTLVAELQYDL